MALTPGSRVGQYEIIAAVGAGGMGEVYRARDSRLDREVAIKVLSAELATDPKAVARFEREAMSVAKLSHPNILSIFEFTHDASTAFVVTEFVDGDTLRARLEIGPLPQRRAVGYALQIAKGVAAAHSRGIVHRDLKPENVMITRDDQVKILDFGLAKAIDLGERDTTRGNGVTTAGTVLGTYGYMAPEQVRGVTIDHRADIFAFAAVLYEMLSGERAFSGDTAADTMTAILTKDPPDFDTAGVSISPALDRIVRRCVEKQPDLRFQSANDLAFALETLSTPSTSSASAAAITEPARVSPSISMTWIPWAVAVVGVAAAAASWLWRPTIAPEAAWAHFTRITEAAGEETSPSLSPDGDTVVYTMRVNGQWDLYSQRVGGRNATPVINDPQRNERGPIFSPDGSLIAFHVSDAVGGVFVAGATGESVRRLTDHGFDPAWSPDGKQIAFGTEEIFDPSSRQGQSTLQVVEIGGGAPRTLAQSDAVQPSWSPSGERIVYWSNTGGQRDIYTVAASGGTPVAVTNDSALDWSPVWSPDGKYIYFASDRGVAMNLWRVAIDQSSGKVLGIPEPVTAGVQALLGIPRFSKDGERLTFRSRVAAINPIAIPLDPATLRAGTPVVLDTRNNIRIPSSVSPDGRFIAYYSVGEQQEDLFIGPTDGPMRRVTDDPSRDRAPVFTHDNRTLVFQSNRDGKWNVWSIGIDGGGLRKVADAEAGAVYVQVSPKGDMAVFSADTAQAVYLTPLASTATPTKLAGTTIDGKYFSPTSWSPDAAHLAGMVVSDNGKPAGVALYDLATSTTTMLSSDATPCVQWMADGRRVMYFTKNGSELVVMDTVSRTRTVLDAKLPSPSTNEVFALSPDNRSIYYGAAREESDIWIVERK